MRVLLKTLLFALFVLIDVNSFAGTKDSLKTNKPKLSAFPVVFYSPDTKLGVGGAGLLTFNFKNDTLGARRSSVSFGFAYTQLNQVLTYLPYQLFLKNRKYWVYGEVGYYQYVFNYFGIGNNFPVDYIEKFDAILPRLRINALQQIKPSMYIGIRYVFDDFSISLRDTTASLANDRPIGYDGGRVSGLGILFNYDSRDNIFFPSKGILLETMIYGESAITGSNFEYTRLSVDFSKYFPIRQKHVLALNAFAASLSPKVPFHQMAMLGGAKELRGYFEGKYRDNSVGVLQAEYRFPLFWRFGIVAFGGYGVVGNKITNLDFKHLRYNYGTGLRFQLDSKQKINLRLDYGIGYKSTGTYLTISEAF
jgi:outer membrane protein assembly factor BamA